ncbi:FBP C-terminal treble-clef zinc-finger [Agromyces sp. CF514]|uniref:FBP domain-containing protein n=1 Tax=Agromyces sp. CF514 TaxID=1881031 RepID=UPI0008E3FBE0|nr:FBP domain-containing protein [Agromyces sp. CF514]SFR69512.1 FBP C-terminal treble-clef zinc-finger [Agromyces sp. CF514]
MQALTEAEVRDAFRNASAAELTQLSLPVSFFVTEWAHLDAFAWRDPRIAGRGYLVTELDGAAVGVVLRAPSSSGSHHRAAICNLCHTQQPADQVAMVSARRAGAAGERGDSIGVYMCSDLACQETVRLGRPAAPSEVLPSLRELERIEGLARRTRAFVADVVETG